MRSIGGRAYVIYPRAKRIKTRTHQVHVGARFSVAVCVQQCVHAWGDSFVLKPERRTTTVAVAGDEV